MTGRQELFEKIDTRLLQDDAPSVFLEEISREPAFQEHPFRQLCRMKNTKQSPQHHPEGSVWNHTMLVTDCAARRKAQSGNPRAFLWAALLHDIGKPPTTRVRKGKITSYDHDLVGARMAREFLSEFSQEEAFIFDVAALVRWHMQILFVVNRLPFAQIHAMAQQTDLHEVALLGLCDRLGRAGANEEKEKENIRMFLERCSAAQRD